MKKFFIGIIISVFALGFLFWKLDLSGFYNIQERWQPIYLIPFFMAVIWGLFLFSWRWYLLLGKKISFKTSVLSAYIGVGANQFLPARGGDIFRLYLCKKDSDSSYGSLVSSLFLEKVLDFAFIFSAGLGAFFLLGIHQDFVRFVLPLLGILSIVFTLIFVRLFYIKLARFGENVFAKFGKRNFFQDKLTPLITELGEFLTLKNAGKHGALTAATWLVGYGIHYTLLQYLVGIHLSPLETIFIMFCGAVGVMVPSAPSGAGVYHASITSGFVLLGRESSEGLVYATTVHLGQMMALGIITVILYSYWSFTGGSDRSKADPRTI
ncbi:membrane protein, PF03706 family [Leptospira fainei serovar Hurstbridge str. BUT 6]|uniref:Membrane protein, PF03706 family n=1 Tax=Leptospira fainei serovar Hurstbridge str. BUT 6 TaxID=1193011 RepID=S3V3C8_9LEPT|nr:lysylphosphatidylglycerol synthase transmembrane domain-containing protein [Leptospira fainei]EPG75139.1 membrane protein, PF03706 family [Leptospira fainei serovar Hurstbridge str. BUT 6]